jgi:hypothetical protein
MPTPTPILCWLPSRKHWTLMGRQDFELELLNFSILISTLNALMQCKRASQMDISLLQDVKTLDMRVFEFSDLGLLQKSATYFVAFLHHFAISAMQNDADQHGI